MASLDVRSATRVASLLGRGPAFLFQRPRIVLNAIPAAIAAGVLFGAWWLYVDLSDIHHTVLPRPDRVFREGWEFRL